MFKKRKIIKRILITHVDLDGAGAAIMFRKKYPNIEVEYRNHSSIDKRAKELLNEQKNYEKIFFADIIPSDMEVGTQMIKSDKFVLIDHHVSQEYLKEERTYNPEFCATYLSAVYLFGDIENNYDLEQTSLSDKEKTFIYSVDAWDVWKLNSKYRDNGEKLNYICFYYGLEEFTNRYKDFNETKQQFSLKHKGFYKDRLSIDIQVDGVYWNDMSYLCSNQVLKNRIKKDFFYTLSDEDSFIMYLCHSILGKRKFKKEYWNRLRKLSNKKLDNKYIITTLSNVWNEKIAKMLCLYVSWNRISLIEKKIPSLVFYFIIKKPKRIVTFCLLFFRWLSRRKTIC